MLTQTMVEEALAGAEEANDQEVVTACQEWLNGHQDMETTETVWRGVNTYI